MDTTLHEWLIANLLSLVAVGVSALSALAATLIGKLKMAKQGEVHVGAGVWDKYPDIPRMCDNLGLDAGRDNEGNVVVKGSEALVNAFCMAFHGIINTHHIADSRNPRAGDISQTVDARIERVRSEPAKQIPRISERNSRIVRRRIVLPDDTDE